MKFTWEEKDVECGRIVRSPTTATNNKAMIGYEPGKGVLLLSLSDGLIVIHALDKKDMAHWLNESRFEPTDDDRESVKAADILSGRARR